MYSLWEDLWSHHQDESISDCFQPVSGGFLAAHYRVEKIVNSINAPASHPMFGTLGYTTARSTVFSLIFNIYQSMWLCSSINLYITDDFSRNHLSFTTALPPHQHTNKKKTIGIRGLALSQPWVVVAINLLMIQGKVL